MKVTTIGTIRPDINITLKPEEADILFMLIGLTTGRIELPDSTGSGFLSDLYTAMKDAGAQQNDKFSVTGGSCANKKR